MERPKQRLSAFDDIERLDQLSVSAGASSLQREVSGIARSAPAAETRSALEGSFALASLVLGDALLAAAQRVGLFAVDAVFFCAGFRLVVLGSVLMAAPEPSC